MSLPVSGDVSRPGADPDVISSLVACAGTHQGLDASVVEGLLHELVGVVCTGRRLTGDHRQASRRRGAEAAARGVAAHALLDVQLTLAANLVPHLPEVLGRRGARPLSPEAQASAVQSMLWAVRDSLEASVEGFADVRRDMVRQEASVRREFVDDLLSGRVDVSGLIERAARFGLTLGPPHAVALVRCGERWPAESAVLRSVETAMRACVGDRDLLVATKDGLLVLVIGTPSEAGRPDAATSTDAPRARATRSVRACLARLDPALSAVGTDWQAGIGGVHSGASAVQRSYDEARETLAVAERLGVRERVVEAEDFLVYRVLLRDRAAITDLVTSVLGPLRDARGGADPLIDTLLAYFEARGVAVAAAQRLFLSVRALTYRLERVRIITGYDVNDPHQRFTLQAAALGARLLGWPQLPIP